MFGRFPLICFFTIVYITSFSQSDADKELLYNEIRTGTTISDRINALQKVRNMYPKADSINPYLPQLIDDAIAQDSFDIAMIAAHCLWEINYYFYRDINKVDSLVSVMYDFKGKCSITNHVLYYEALRTFAHDQNEFLKAISYQDSIIAINTQYNQAELTTDYSILGGIKGDNNDFSGSIRAYREGYLARTDKSNQKEVMNCVIAMAHKYGELGLYNEAGAAYDNYEKDNDLSKLGVGEISYYLNRAEIANGQDDLDLMGKVINKADSIITNGEKVDSYLELFLLEEKVHHALRINKPKKAKSYLDLMEPYKKEFAKNPSIKLFYDFAYMDYNMKAGDVNKAISYINQELEKSPAKYYLEKRVTLLGKKITMLEKSKDIKSLAETQAEYLHLSDSLDVLLSAASVQYHRTEFETTIKEAQIKEREAEINLLKTQKALERNRWLFGILSLLSIGSISFLLYNRKQIKKQKSIEEKFAEDLIQFQEAEKKKVSENLHDGVGQSLLLIKNKVILEKNADMQSMVDEVIKEVNQISKTLHPYRVEQLGLTLAIENNIDQIDTATELFIDRKIDNIDGIFNTNQELNLYRIIQELMSNVIKHSNATGCKLSVVKASNHVRIDVEDNGTGFDFSEEYEKIGSLGLKTLKNRTGYLDGNITFSSTKDKGTSVSIKIPIVTS